MSFLGAALLIAACGFEPSLAPGGAQETFRAKVDLDAPVDPNSFLLRARLEDRLGPVTEPVFALSYSVGIGESSSGVTPDNVITRGNINGTARYALRELSSGTEITRGEVSSFTSYGTTGTTASTAFAREEAIGRVLTILADQIIARLTAVSELAGQ